MHLGDLELDVQTVGEVEGSLVGELHAAFTDHRVDVAVGAALGELLDVADQVRPGPVVDALVSQTGHLELDGRIEVLTGEGAVVRPELVGHGGAHFVVEGLLQDCQVDAEEGGVEVAQLLIAHGLDVGPAAVLVDDAHFVDRDLGLGLDVVEHPVDAPLLGGVPLEGAIGDAFHAALVDEVPDVVGLVVGDPVLDHGSLLLVDGKASLPVGLEEEVLHLLLKHEVTGRPRKGGA